MTALLQLLLGAAPGPEGHLEWTSGQAVIVAAVGGALLAFAASLPGERSAAARVAEALLTAIAGMALVVALAGPIWVEESGREEPGRVAVLIDGSRSMSVREGDSTRGELADALLKQLDGPNVDVYHFGSDLAVGPPGAYDLPGTDLEGALAALAERSTGEKLAGVVVITDGIDRGLMRRRFASDPAPAGPPPLPGPLTVYQVGSPGDLHDLAVRAVDSGGYGFVRSPLVITAHVQGTGYPGRTFNAQLLRDGKLVTTKPVQLDGDGNAVVAFDFVPDTAGRSTYAVQVPVFDDDAVPSNNLVPVVVRVVRDRIRVLQVAGAPSWDVKFMRRFLKGDPSVDLVSFFILRTNQDMDGTYDDRELSLIPFPHEKLFTDELSTFDLVIFQDFDYQPYFKLRGNPKVFLENLRKFVAEDGHALAMIGGDRSFDLGAYDGTPLAEVLPLKLGVPKNPADRVCEGLCDPIPFLPALTDDGRRHPITRLAPDPDENEAWWARLHPMDGTNLSLGPTDGAAVLLQHPSDTTPSGAPLPILAVKEAGKGRTMALTVDASWRWSFNEAAEGRGNQAYLRFWKNAFRWLVADPTASRVTVETPRENYALGDTVRVVVRARDPGFAAIKGAKVSAEITGAGTPIKLEGWTGPDGEIALEWPADRRGAMRVAVTVVDGDGKPVGADETVFAVTTRDPELEEVIPDTAFLKWVAASAGGRYYGPGEQGPVVLDPAATRTLWDREETPLGRAPALGLIALLASGAAWIVRRRAGLR